MKMMLAPVHETSVQPGQAIQPQKKSCRAPGAAAFPGVILKNGDTSYS